MCVCCLLQFEAEYRRFALKRNGPGGFQEFYRLLQTIHHIPGVDVLLGYADVHGDLLPINNDENFHKAISSANPLLRIIITKKGKRKERKKISPGIHFLRLDKNLVNLEIVSCKAIKILDFTGILIASKVYLMLFLIFSFLQENHIND